MQPKRLVLIGAGLTHLLALKDLETSDLRDQLSIFLIHPRSFVEIEGAKLPLTRVAEVSGLHLRKDRVVSIDPIGQLVEFESGERFEFDLLSLDFSLSFSTRSQSESDASLIEGSEIFGHDAYDPTKFDEGFEQLIERAKALGGEPLNFIQIGAGRTGCETLLSHAQRLRRELPKQPMRFTLIERGARLLPRAPEWTARQVATRMSEFRTRIMLESRVRSLTKEGVELESGIHMPSHFTSLAVTKNLPLFARTFRTGLHPKIFTNEESIAGAKRRAKDLAANLRRAIRGEDLTSIRQSPTLHFIEDGAGGDFAYFGRWPLPHLKANRWLRLKQRRAAIEGLKRFF